MKRFQNIKFILPLLLYSILGMSCKKFIEVDAPITSINGGNVYNEDVTAIAAVTGILAKTSNIGLSYSISVTADLSADNLVLYDLTNSAYQPYYTNALLPRYTPVMYVYWNNAYPLIYNCNSTIKGLIQSKALTSEVKQRLLGETYFLRAFYYYYLVNFYGEVPLALSDDYEVNSRLARRNVEEVYKQIVDDLKNAIDLLDDRYVNGTLINATSDRTRPNRLAATALLARVYLHLKNYSQAEAAATQIISKSEIYSSNIPLNQVFLKNSLETIWALQSVSGYVDTQEGANFILPADGPNSYANMFYLSKSLFDSFEDNDQRKVYWISNVNALGINYPFATKYKVAVKSGETQENVIALRVAEQYLIRAEAREEQNNLQGSEDDLNVIRSRAGLPEISGISQVQLKIAIAKERRSELFTEWGHRWFDLKRTGTIDAVMAPATAIKGGTWSNYKSLYPIPFEEIMYDNALTQNLGYN